jgi:hypothetical protein
MLYPFKGIEHMDDVKGAECCAVNRQYGCRHFGTKFLFHRARADGGLPPGIAEVRDIAEPMAQEGQI